MNKRKPVRNLVEPSESQKEAKLEEPEENKTWLDISSELDRSDEYQSSIRQSSVGDDLGDELGASVVVNMTSGEDMLMDELDARVAEEVGGSFIETSADDGDEFPSPDAVEPRAGPGDGEDEDDEDPEEEEPREKKKQS